MKTMKVHQSHKDSGTRFLTMRDVPVNLLRQVKAQAALNGMTMKEFILKALRKAVEESERRSQTR